MQTHERFFELLVKLRRVMPLAVLAEALFSGFHLTQRAAAQTGGDGSYSLAWSAVSGSGGVLIGGDYRLVTTISQAEAETGISSGGAYQVMSGVLVGIPRKFHLTYLPQMVFCSELWPWRVRPAGENP